MSKLPNVGTTIFTVMSKLAKEYDAVNLSQGFPNFPIDKKLREVYKDTVDEDVHQYALMPGNSLLRQAIRAQTKKVYHREISIESELLVTAGGTQGIFTAIQALVDNGDEVVILDPAYDCYDPAVVLAGGRLVHVQLDAQFRPDFEKIKDALNSRTRMVLINTPHNPSGTIWTKKDFEDLIGLLEKYPRVLLLSDEVYEYITYHHKHISAHHFEALRNRSIVISSFGKTFHITGWKVGYMIAPEPLMKEIKKVHQFIVFSVNSVAQVTLGKYLKQADTSLLGPFYQKKRDLFRDLLKDSRFELRLCDGTYFQTVSYRAISDQPDTEFVQELTKKYGVASIPLSAFYSDHTDLKLIRLCFAKDENTLRLAAERLSQV